MIYRTRHTTIYEYTEPAAACQNILCLTPRARENQSLLRSEVEIDPEPDSLVRFHDYFGNELQFLAIHDAHQRLVITARSVVDVRPHQAPLEWLTPPWEEVRDMLASHRDESTLEAFQFTLESPFVTPGAAFAEYAVQSFPKSRPLLEAVNDLSHRIHQEFDYDPRATTIATPVDEVLRQRHGVCQDFAHVMIGCLRALGLPARYVSGYLRSDPRWLGAEQSHAWVSAFCPGLGWVDFDPTNDVRPSEHHVTLAWGRDYGDVSPIKGVTLGSSGHTMRVVVEVLPLDPAPAE